MNPPTEPGHAPGSETDEARLARLASAFDETAYHPDRLALLRLEHHARRLPEAPAPRRHLGLLLSLLGVVAAPALVMLLAGPSAEAPSTHGSAPDRAGHAMGEGVALGVSDDLLEEAFPQEDDLESPLGPLDDGLAEADLEALQDDELEAIARAYAETLATREVKRPL